MDLAFLQSIVDGGAPIVGMVAVLFFFIVPFLRYMLNRTDHHIEEYKDYLEGKIDKGESSLSNCKQEIATLIEVHNSQMNNLIKVHNDAIKELVNEHFDRVTNLETRLLVSERENLSNIEGYAKDFIDKISNLERVVQSISKNESEITNVNIQIADMRKIIEGMKETVIKGKAK